MGKLIDLTGQRFGRLLVLNKENNYKNKNSMWLCRCDCGNKVKVIGHNLKTNHTKSCGCLQKEKTSQKNYKDLVGKRFGRLIVVELDHIDKSSFFKCKCDCGKIVVVWAANLKNGTTKSCGCYRKELSSKRNYINLVGQTFGRLTVIDEAERTKRGVVKFLCQCSCENKTRIEVLARSLKSGNTTSCGCLKKELVSKRNYKNLVGKIFGRLTVLKDVGRKHGEVLWLCKCNCGNEVNITANNLKNGGTKSCGCLNESWIASELKKYCIKNHNAKSEYKILRNPETGYWLSYDIFIPVKSIYIEVHGGQHYKFIEYFHKTKDVFEYNKKLDKLKKNYAKKNGIYIEVDIRKIKTPEEAIGYINKFL